MDLNKLVRGPNPKDVVRSVIQENIHLKQMLKTSGEAILMENANTPSLQNRENGGVIQDLDSTKNELEGALRANSSIRAELDTVVRSRDWYQSQVHQARQSTKLLLKLVHFSFFLY